MKLISLNLTINKYIQRIIYWLIILQNEYNIHIDFFKYGFRSIRDMAYKLPSIFYVKVTDDDENNCVLFEADRRSELEDILEG